jgi:hypothetical protein
MGLIMRKLQKMVALAASGLVLATGGVAVAATTGNPGHGNQGSTQSTGTTTTTTTTTPGGKSVPSNAKAYGVYCQNQSKQHVAGQKGTPFSQCVTAMAKLAKGTTDSPKVACASMSKKHVAGQKGTPYSNCVSAGAKLLKDKHK